MSAVLAVTIVDRAGETLGGFLPRLGGAIALLVVGVLVARLVARLIGRALHAAGVDDLADRAGVTAPLRRIGVAGSFSGLVARIVRLTLTVVVVFAALSLLGLQFLSQTLNAVVLFIPDVVAAAALVLAGVVLADLVRSRVDRLTEQMDLPLPLGQLVGLAVLGVFVLTAAAQVGVPTAILTALVGILIAAAAATVAIAFGLGGRDAARAISAGRYIRTSYELGQTIAVGDVRGEIVALEQTAVVLRTGPDTTVRVPNHRVLDAVVSVHEPPRA
jgi:small-conductance mechanosensitive channel